MLIESLPHLPRWMLGLSIVILALFVVSGCSSASITPAQGDEAQITAAPAPLPELDPELVVLGETIYLQQCASCHGKQGEGQPNWKVKGPDGAYPAPPHTAEGHTWHHGDGTLFKYIQRGGAGMNIPNFTSNMPAFGETLTDEEIIAVITYLKSLWPEKQRRAQFEASQLDPFPR